MKKKCEKCAEKGEKDWCYYCDAQINTLTAYKDKDGYFYNTTDGQNAELKDGINYQSGMRYDTYNGDVDLEGRPINIVGNLR